ncbi:MAG: hypothetical protein ACO1N7_07375, partial [Sphingobacteriaceae bacterium]
LTLNEQNSQFALWCIMSSPLILGHDPRNMKGEELEIITNKKAIGINQDPTEQGHRIKQNGKTEIWAKKLKDNSYAVLLLNRDEANQTIKLSWDDLNLSKKHEVNGVFESKSYGAFENEFAHFVAPNSSLFIIVKPK